MNRKSVYNEIAIAITQIKNYHNQLRDFPKYIKKYGNKIKDYDEYLKLLESEAGKYKVEIKDPSTTEPTPLGDPASVVLPPSPPPVSCSRILTRE